jgi:hypothetical protein
MKKEYTISFDGQFFGLFNSYEAATNYAKRTYGKSKWFVVTVD